MQADQERAPHMFDPGTAYLPKDITHHKNLMPRSEEYARLAYREMAKADFIRFQADTLAGNDKISLRKGLIRDAEDRENYAQQVYSRALDLQKEYKENRTTGEKMKPILLNTTIGVVVLAEVISLPLLIINICQMSHHKKQQQQPSS